MSVNLESELMAIYRDQGSLTPAVVVDAATPTDHPLHHAFDWDDESAGHRFRLQQAAKLIRSVRIVYAEDRRGSKYTRRFQALRLPEKPNEYTPTEEILADDMGRQLLLRQLQRDVLAMRRRYSHLQEFDKIIRTQLLGEEGEGAA